MTTVNTGRRSPRPYGVFHEHELSAMRNRLRGLGSRGRFLNVTSVTTVSWTLPTWASWRQTGSSCSPRPAYRV